MRNDNTYYKRNATGDATAGPPPWCEHQGAKPETHTNLPCGGAVPAPRAQKSPAVPGFLQTASLFFDVLRLPAKLFDELARQKRM